jgi:hypothetical protein
VGAVRVYLTSKLWLGAWLGAKRKDKKQEVRSKDNKLKDIPYLTSILINQAV